MQNNRLRLGDWIQTYTGKQFYPLDARVEDIDILDIAHSLSLQCRYTGHCEFFYSVAQHSVLISRYCSKEEKMWGLLHDSSEAYLTDVPRPIKPYINGYKEIELRLEEVIARKFGLTGDTMPASVKKLDNAILVNEMETLMKPPLQPWTFYEPKIEGLVIEPWTWERSKAEFLAAYYDYIQW